MHDVRQLLTAFLTLTKAVIAGCYQWSQVGTYLVQITEHGSSELGCGPGSFLSDPLPSVRKPSPLCLFPCGGYSLQLDLNRLSGRKKSRAEELERTVSLSRTNKFSTDFLTYVSLATPE